MQWPVDIDAAEADGTLSGTTANELKRRARETMISYAVNLALFVGVAMVIGGAAFWLEDRVKLTVLGLVLAVIGIGVLLSGHKSVRIIANATAMIGTTLALGAATHLFFEDTPNRVLPGLLIGGPAFLAGLVARWQAPERLDVIGGWLVVLGAGVHVTGILATESDLDLGWLVLHYAGVIAIALGIWLNVRFLTAIAIVPLAAALSSSTSYWHASYSIAIYEATLTILQMSVLALASLWASVTTPERLARHARILGQMALIWINMAFWIGSLWGDVMGFHLWGPRWTEVTQGIQDWHTKSEAWRAANEAFEATTITLSADLFAAVWALGIVTVSAWAAYTARRAVLNISVVFGAIHFYTQYFERLEATPVAFLIAGIIAILAAWGLWQLNRRYALQPSGKEDHAP